MNTNLSMLRVTGFAAIVLGVLGCLSKPRGSQQSPKPISAEQANQVKVWFSSGFVPNASRGGKVVMCSEKTTISDAIALAGGVPSGVVDFEFVKALPTFGIHLHRGNDSWLIGSVDKDLVPRLNDRSPQFVEDGDTIYLGPSEPGIEAARRLER
ncbi:MAG: hypothetical protein J0M04_23645 [Verrucomicrobia bacterium]|nr:hypothetical protein [Verrucomicrobiota bacterium]